MIWGWRAEVKGTVVLNLPALEDELSNIKISVSTNSVRQTSSKLAFIPKYNNYANVLPGKKKIMTS